MYVFTYGNLNPTKLDKLVGIVKIVSPAILHKHRVVFTKSPQLNDQKGGTADLVEDVNSSVIGMIYDLTCEQVHLLNAKENVHLHVYNQTTIQVIDPCRGLHNPIVYRKPHREIDMPCTLEYAKDHVELCEFAHKLFQKARFGTIKGKKRSCREALPVIEEIPESEGA